MKKRILSKCARRGREMARIFNGRRKIRAAARNRGTNCASAASGEFPFPRRGPKISRPVGKTLMEIGSPAPCGGRRAVFQFGRRAAGIRLRPAARKTPPRKARNLKCLQIFHRKFEARRRAGRLRRRDLRTKTPIRYRETRAEIRRTFRKKSCFPISNRESALPNFPRAPQIWRVHGAKPQSA